MKNLKNILIIGAGIAGPSLAYWLKKYGFLPTIIEKSESLRTGGYPIDIRGIAVDCVKQMGLYETIVNNRRKTNHGLCVNADGDTVLQTDGEESGFRQEDDVEIVRGSLVKILMDAISDVPCRFGCEVTSIENFNDQVTVTYSDNSKESYDLVIAGDGMHSSVRKMLFKNNEYKIRHLDHFICVFDSPNYLNLEEDELHHESEGKHVSIYKATGKSRALVGLMMTGDPNKFSSKDPSKQKEFLKNAFKNVGWETPKLIELMDQAEEFYFDSISQVIMPNWHKGRVILAGDAGYCASPLSGQGTSLALVGAYTLAGELKDCDGDYTKAFERHEEIMKPYIEANQSFGHWVSKNFLFQESHSPEETKKRNKEILRRIRIAANSITLKKYEESNK